MPLAPPGQLTEAGFDPLPDLPARLRTFVDAYGLSDRKAILPELRACTLDEPEQLGWLQGIGTGGSAKSCWAEDWRHVGVSGPRSACSHTCRRASQ